MTHPLRPSGSPRGDRARLSAHLRRLLATKKRPARRLRLDELEDRAAPAVQLISQAYPASAAFGTGGNSQAGSFSADGRYAAFWSYADNLVANDTNGQPDVFVRDNQTGTVTRVSVGPGGAQADSGSASPVLSADGRYVAFYSYATNLAAGDTNGQADVFVRDLQTGTTTRVSVSSAGGQGTGFALFPSLSADGRYVAFHSSSPDLVAGDTNSSNDVFVHDRQTGQTIRVSVDSAGAQGNSDSDSGILSADGKFVVFESTASNLVGSDTNGRSDIFVRDLTAGTTTRVSVDSAGAQGNNASFQPAVSADGHYVAFSSLASNLVGGDTNGKYDIFVRDRVGNTTTRVSVGPGGAQATGDSTFPYLSGDGRYVAYTSVASDLVAGDTNGVSDGFVRDRTAGTTTRVTVGSDGAQGNGSSYVSSISPDGRVVGVGTSATNLVPNDANGQDDALLRDTRLGATALVSRRDFGLSPPASANDQSGANYASGARQASDDGRYVVFSSGGTDIVPGDTNGQFDVFVRDTVLGTVARVSVNSAGAQAGSGSDWATISGDGRFVAFVSLATNLVAGDTNGQSDVFVRDLVAGTTSRASVSTGGAEADNGSYDAALSGGGRFLAFRSFATNLVAGDANGKDDVFVRDLLNNTTTRVSVDSAGAEGNNSSVGPAVTDDGRYVAFLSAATNLVAGDTNGKLDVFVRDTVGNTTTRVSVGPAGAQGDGDSAYPSITGDGRYLAFESNATNLVPGDTNGAYDGFVRDLVNNTTTRVSVGTGGAQGNLGSGRTSISADGRYVAFNSDATNFTTTDANGRTDVFVRDRTGATTSLMSRTPGGASGNDYSYVPAMSPDGRYAMFQSDAADLVSGDANGQTDVFLADVAPPAPPVLWTRQAGTAGFDTAYAVAVAGDGGVVAAGTTSGDLGGTGSDGSPDAFVRKYDGAGSVVWIRQFGTAGGEAVYGVSAAGDGGVVVVGSTDGDLGGTGNAGGNDVFVRKYDGAGTVLWTRQFGTAGIDFGLSVSATADGGVVVAGYTAGSLGGVSAGGDDAFVRKYDGAGNEVWTRQYGTAGQDYARSVSVAADGGVLVAGYTTGAVGGANAGNYDAYVRKYDGAGNVVWTSQFGTAAYDGAQSVSAAPDGGALVAGYTLGALGGPNAGSYDAYVRKYDAAGTVLWTRQFGTAASDFGLSVSAAADGGAVAAGYTGGTLGGSAAGGDDGFVRKYDGAGNVLWTDQFGTAVSDVVHSVATTGDGQVVAAGVTDGNLAGTGNAGSADVFVRKYGRFEPDPWTRQYGLANDDVAVPVAVAGDGGVLTGGYTAGSLGGPTAGAFDAYVRKFDQAGNPVWIRQFGTATPDIVWSVVRAGDGGVLVTGTTSGTLPGESSAGLQDVFVRKYDAAGNVLWTDQFGTGGNDQVWSMALAGDGGALVTGYVQGALPGQSVSGPQDAFVRKYDAAGNVLWTREYGSTSTDEAFSVALAGDGGVLVAGTTAGALPGQSFSGGTYDAYVRKYDATGTLLWTRQFGTASADYGTSVALAGDGGVLVGGYTYGVLGAAGLGAEDAYVRKYDAAGTLQWTRQFGTATTDWALSLAPAGDGGFLVGGMTYGNVGGPNAGGFDAYVSKFDGAGNPVWNYQVGTPLDDYGLRVAAAGDGGLLLAGHTYGDLGATNAGGFDAFVLKFQEPQPQTTAGLPQVTSATTAEDAQSSSGLVITPAAGDTGVTHFEITGITGGTLYQNNGTTPISDGEFITVADGAAGLKFTPAPDLNTPAGDAFGFTVRAAFDNDGTGLGDPATATITVTEVNDPPTATDDPLSSILEDSGTRTIPFASLLGNDGKGPNESGQALTITSVSNPVGGTVDILGSNVRFMPTTNFFGPASFDYVVQDNGTTNGSSDFLSDTGHVTFTVTSVNDFPNVTLTGGGITYTENGPAKSLDTGATVTDVEHNWAGGIVQAQITGNASAADELSILQTGGVTLSALSVLYSGTPVGATNAASVTTGSALTVTLNGSATDAAVQAILRALAYRNTSDAPSTLQRTVTLTISDAADTTTGTRTVDVTAVNDAPVLTGATSALPGTDEDTTGGGTLVSAVLSGAGYSDPDGAALSGIAVTATAGNGTWQYSTDGTTWTAFGPVTGTSALLVDSGSQVRYMPDGKNGETATFTFRAWDQTAGTASNGSPSYANPTPTGGTAAYSSATAQASLMVSGVNDAPVLTPYGPTFPTIGEDNTASTGQAVSDLLGSAVADVDNGAVQGIAVIGTVDGNGRWQFSTDGGTNWANAGTVSAGSALLLRPADRLKFIPDTYNGTTASVTYVAWDQSAGGFGTTADAQTRGGATAFSTASDTATITVTDVNDAPTLTGGTSSLPGTNEDASSSGTLVSDILTGYGDVDTVHLSGIAVTAATGNGTWQYSTDGTTWTAFGPVTDSAALLLDSASQVRYMPDGMNGETVGFTFRAWDQTSGTASNGTPHYGNTSPNGSVWAYSSGTAQTTLFVSSVNDAPTLTGNATLAAVPEDTTSPPGETLSSLFSGATFTDVDTGSSQSGFAVTGNAALVTDGAWEYSADAGAHWFPVGAVSNGVALMLDLNTLVRFVPAADYFGNPGGLTVHALDNTYAGFSTVTGDGTENRVTGNVTSPGGGSSIAAGANTISTSIDPVADTPTPVDGSTQADTPTAVGNPKVLPAAVDGASVTYFQITNITNGTLNVVHGATVTPVMEGDFVSAADAGGFLRFTPAAAKANPGTSFSFDAQAAVGNDADDLGGSVVTVNIAVTDSIAPDTAIDSKPPAFSNSSSADIGYSGTDNISPAVLTFEYRLDPAGPTDLWLSAPTNPLSFTGLADGSHKVEVRATDEAGNTDATPAAYAWTVDTVNPTTGVSAPSVNYAKTGTTVTYTVTYADTNFDKSTLAAGDVTLNKTGTADATTVTVSPGSGSTRTVTITGITGDGTLGITVKAGSAVDKAGNTADASADSATFVVDNTKPAVGTSAPSVGYAKSGTNVTYTLTYTDANFDKSTLTAAGITLNKTGTANGTVSVDAGTGATRTVTITGITGNGTLGITVKPGTAVDLAGNTAAGSAASTTFVVDNIAPVLTISVATPTKTVRGPVSWTVTAADANPGTFALTPADVTLVGSTATLTARSVAVAPAAGGGYTVTVDDIRGGAGTLKIKVKAGVAVDLAGNANVLTGPGPAVTVTAPKKPTVAQAAPPAFLAAGATYADSISYSNPAAGSQTLTGAYLEVRLPAYGTFQPTQSTAGWTKVAGTGPVRYRLALGDLAPGAHGTVSFVVTFAASTPYGAAVPVTVTLGAEDAPGNHVLATSTITLRFGIPRTPR